MKISKSWFDELGLLHHVNNPTTDSSENELLFTAEYIMLSENSEQVVDAELALLQFYYDEVVEDRHMSHDNKTGVVATWGAAIKDSIFKVGNRWWLHPRDIVYYGYMKHGYWFYPLLPIVSISNIISCARTWKDHEGIDHRTNTVVKWKSLTTSGKMLAFVRNKSAGLKLTQKICTWLIERNPEFRSWTNVAKIYFPHVGDSGENHPVVTLMAEYEMKP